MRVVCCATDEVCTCFTVVSIANVAAKPKATAKATSTSRGPVMSASNPDPADRRNFSIETILLVGEREPSLRHALVAPARGLAVGALREPQAILGVFPEYIGLLHCIDVGSAR